jgi:hypothetical protein
MRLEDDKSTQIGVEEFFATKISWLADPLTK